MIRPIDEIIVHCTATRPEWMANDTAEAKRDEIRRWHVQERGWKDIGYAAIIDRDGTIAWGRDLDKDGDYFDDIGAHTARRNSRSVGIALVGGFGSAANDKFADHFTIAQDIAARNVIAQIQSYTSKALPVNGHNQYSNKACPGFNAPNWFSNRPPRTLAGSTTLQSAAVGTGSSIAAALTALSELNGNTQIVVVSLLAVTVVALAIIFRERIKMWARGVQ